MAAKKNQIDWPTTFGDKRVALWNHSGPASYTQVVNGSPATGGDTITQAELQSQGLKAADLITALLTSDDGQFEVACIPVAGNSSSGPGVTPSFGANGSVIIFRLRWLVSATGAEVAALTNLSQRTIKLLAIGPK